MDLVHRSEFEILANTTFRKMDLFPFQGEWWQTPILLGSLESVVFRILADGQRPETQ
jgi:hypothetical protein